ESVREEIVLRFGAVHFAFGMRLVMGWIHTIRKNTCHFGLGKKGPPRFEQIDINRHVHMELRRLVLYWPIARFVKRGKMDDMVAIESPPCLLEPVEGLVLARQIHQFRAKCDHLAAKPKAPANSVDQRSADEACRSGDDHVLHNTSYGFAAAKPFVRRLLRS